MTWVDRLVPHLGDLPGPGWHAVGLPGGDSDASTDDVLAIVGPGFPDPSEVVDTSSSEHFVRQRSLVHGMAVRFDSTEAADRAAAVLGGRAFAGHLGASVAADLTGAGGGPEVLAVDVDRDGPPFRVTFNGVGPAGAIPVYLDVVVLHVGSAVSLLWFADAPDPFPPGDRAEIVRRVGDRLSQAAAGG